jgi:hypothetical protein
MSSYYLFLQAAPNTHYTNNNLQQDGTCDILDIILKFFEFYTQPKENESFKLLQSET